jgi:hypothetical protein
VVTRRHTGTDGSNRSVSSTAAGIRPAKLSENRIEAISASVSRSGYSSWVASRSLLTSSPP